MKRETYLRVATALPLLVPLVLAPLVRLDVDPGEVFSLLGFSAVFGGVPYVLVAVPALYLLRGRPPTSYWRLARWAPLLFAVFFGVAITMFGAVLERKLVDLLVMPLVIALFAPFVIAIGYLHVLLAWLGYLALDRAGVFRDPADGSPVASRP